MIRKIVLVAVAAVLAYVVWIQVQVVDQKKSQNQKVFNEPIAEDEHKVYVFSFTKYTDTGVKEIEIEGDSADIFSNTVNLLNVVAKAYADEAPVTITADKGHYQKDINMVHIEQNVVATTEDGARLLTEELDIYPSKHQLENEVETRVKKSNIDINGVGTHGDTQLKKVQFKKNVTVVVKQDETQQDPTVITCDGPLEIDYNKNIARFNDNVVAKDNRGTLTADKMDVYYNKVSKQVSKIIAVGNVVIENPGGNKTYSDNVIYLAEEGRVILGGDTEALYAGNSGGGSSNYRSYF